MQLDLLPVGQVSEVWYPARNRFGLPIELVPRNVLVCGYADYSNRFLSVEQFLKRPMVRRGPLLMFVDDLDLLEPRRLYVHATPDYDLPLLKIAALDDDEQVIDWIGREYEPTFLDRCEMMATIRDWQDENQGCGLHLGIGYGGAA